MKWFKLLGHPIVIISLFLLLIIESEHFGGFYIMYILFGFYSASYFAIAAILGIISVFLGYKVQVKSYYVTKCVLYFVGVALMYTSLILFFKQKDRLATFDLTLPLIVFTIFCICSLIFIANALYSLIAIKKTKNGVLDIMP